MVIRRIPKDSFAFHQLAPVLNHTGFFKFQRLLVGVERRLDAERERELIGGVADGEAREDGHVSCAENLIEDFAERRVPSEGRLKVARAAFAAFAEDDCRRFVEFAREPQLREHAINAVRFFACIFEKEDAPARLDLVGRAHQGGDEREIAAD